jgi:hypothetical protein
MSILYKVQTKNRQVGEKTKAFATNGDIRQPYWRGTPE